MNRLVRINNEVSVDPALVAGMQIHEQDGTKGAVLEITLKVGEQPVVYRAFATDRVEAQHWMKLVVDARANLDTDLKFKKEFLKHWGELRKYQAHRCNSDEFRGLENLSQLLSLDL